MSSTAAALVALIVALMALAISGAPQSFTDNLSHATVVMSSDMLGLQWPCSGKFADETCWAGLRLSDMSLQTGP